MGNKSSTTLSTELIEYATKVFRTLDIDGSGKIDKKETISHWKRNFAKLNTEQMFKDLDENKDEAVELDEWLHFWTKVKTAKYTEAEIKFELGNIENGKSWAYFELKK